MAPLTLLGIAVSLAMDAFAVAMACSTVLQPVQRRQVFRLSFHFGLFQALMPIIGWLAGSSVANAVGQYDHWLAFGLLGLIGGRAIISAVRGDGEHFRQADPTKGWSLIGLSVATSLDALAVGLSFSFLHVRIWTAAALIGVVAGVATLLGMLLGSRLGAQFGRSVGLVGGVVLIGIGVHILLSHMGILG